MVALDDDRRNAVLVTITPQTLRHVLGRSEDEGVALQELEEVEHVLQVSLDPGVH